MLYFVLVALALTQTAAFSTSTKPIVSSRRASIALKEAAARREWLAKLDAPTFGKARAAMIEEETAQVAEAAPVIVMDENTAKIAWLSKLDQPKLGVVSEATAKAKWISSIEDDRRKWTTGKVVPTASAPTEEEKEEAIVASFENAETAAKLAWLAKIEK